MKALKQDIKKLAALQTVYKNHRKTVNFVGDDRQMTTFQAVKAHMNNRHTLRLLYATQQILKGKDVIDIEPTWKHNPYDPYHLPLKSYCDQLMKLAEQYEEPIVCDNL